MSVTRIGLMLQPAWVRAAAAVSETSSTFLGGTQTLLQQTAATAREAWDQLLGIFVALLTPASAVVLVFGLWRVSADLEWTESFPIVTGFFSHWQVWIALAIALKLFASMLAAHAARKHDVSGENRPAF